MNEYDVYINVGATQHVKVSAASPEEAIENADYHASLCYHCSKDGLMIDEGDDFTVELDGENVLEEHYADKLISEIATLKAERDELREQAQRNDTPVKSSAEIGRDAILAARKDIDSEVEASEVWILDHLEGFANDLACPSLEESR